jgi:hypothetical protein
MHRAGYGRRGRLLPLVMIERIATAQLQDYERVHLSVMHGAPPLRIAHRVMT